MEIKGSIYENEIKLFYASAKKNDTKEELTKYLYWKADIMNSQNYNSKIAKYRHY